MRNFLGVNLISLNVENGVDSPTNGSNIGHGHYMNGGGDYLYNANANRPGMWRANPQSNMTANNTGIYVNLRLQDNDAENNENNQMNQMQNNHNNMQNSIMSQTTLASSSGRGGFQNPASATVSIEGSM